MSAPWLDDALRVLSDIRKNVRTSAFGGLQCDELERQLRAVALTQKGGWQPIETAPKDGVFLVYMPGERESHRIQVANWHPNVKIIGGLFAFDQPPATHWMPLPPSPAAERAQEKGR